MSDDLDFFGDPPSKSSIQINNQRNGEKPRTEKSDGSYSEPPPKIRVTTGSPLMAGRTPPFSVEAEEYLLACILIDGNDTVSRCLEARIPLLAFYSPANRIVYEKLVEMFNRGTAIDLATLSEELKSSKQLEEIGGYAFLAQISGRIPTTAQAGYFIEKLIELHTLRELIKVATGAVEGAYAYQGGIQEFTDKVEQDIFSVTHGNSTETIKQCSAPTKAALATIAKIMANRGELTGLSSGFKDLDTYTNGFQKGDMIVLAARPSMGKTSLALNFADANLFPKRGPAIPTLIFSLEMSAMALMQRMILARARVNFNLLKQGMVSKNGEEQQRILIASDELSRAPLFIDASSSPNVMEIRAKARRWHRKHPLGFIIVDYLQLMSAVDSKILREQQVSEMSRGLKSLAKDLEVPMVVLSQLNRAVENEKRHPKLSDLRESGSIEQDADVVLFLARPKDADDNLQVIGDSADLLIAKQRNGPVGDIRLTFLRDITKFENFTM